jgi:hypothetical protein
VTKVAISANSRRKLTTDALTQLTQPTRPVDHELISFQIFAIPNLSLHEKTHIMPNVDQLNFEIPFARGIRSTLFGQPPRRG